MDIYAIRDHVLGMDLTNATNADIERIADEQANYWRDTQHDAIENKVNSAAYPVFGRTTAEIYGNEEAYNAYLLSELELDRMQLRDDYISEMKDVHQMQKLNAAHESIAAFMNAIETEIITNMDESEGDKPVFAQKFGDRYNVSVQGMNAYTGDIDVIVSKTVDSASDAYELYRAAVLLFG